MAWWNNVVAGVLNAIVFSYDILFQVRRSQGAARGVVSPAPTHDPWHRRPTFLPQPLPPGPSAFHTYLSRHSTSPKDQLFPSKTKPRAPPAVLGCCFPVHVCRRGACGTCLSTLMTWGGPWRD